MDSSISAAAPGPLVNGRSAASIRLDDRGLQYGDGVFRTMLAYGGQVVDLPRQLAKLAHDAARLGIPAPADDLWRRDIAALPAAALEKAALKLILTRGSGRRGYRPDPDASPARIVIPYPVGKFADSDWLEGIELGVCRTRMGHNPALAGIKHLNRLEQVLARSEPDITLEGLMLDLHEHVISGTMSNIFLIIGGVLHTPKLEYCGVSGVMRDRIVELARSADIPVMETDLNLQTCLDADECFLSNSLIGIWPVRRLVSRDWRPGPVTRYLQTQLRHPLIPVPAI